MLAPPPLPRTLEACLRDLASERIETRASAVADLVRHADANDETRTRALPLLEKALEDEAPRVRSAAAVALADLKAKEALAKLLVAIEDPDLHVRQMALNALGEIGDPRAAPRLRRALVDARPEVRYQAVIAFARLAEVGDVVASLAVALEDEDDAVRYIALRVAEENVDGGSENRRAYDALGDRAEKLIEDASHHVAIAAAIFSAKLGRAAGRPLILRAIRDGGKLEKEDEREAVEMAGELGLTEAVPDLERRVWGVRARLFDTCAFHARIALARMGHDRALQEITRDLTSQDRETLSAAVVAAGRARITAAKSLILALGESAIDPRLRATALAEMDRA